MKVRQACSYIVGIFNCGLKTVLSTSLQSNLLRVLLAVALTFGLRCETVTTSGISPHHRLLSTWWGQGQNDSLPLLSVLSRYPRPPKHAYNKRLWTSWDSVFPSPQTRNAPSQAATMLSGVLIFNQKGENLIFRQFRNDCRGHRLSDVFRIQVISNAQVRSPILTLGSTTFSHVKHENIYIVGVTKSNANAALVFEFLYRLIALGKSYFGKLDEEAVKNNFVLIYELLDGE